MLILHIKFSILKEKEFSIAFRSFSYLKLNLLSHFIVRKY